MERPPHEQDAPTRPGFCGVTDSSREGDCLAGQKGAWPVSRRGAAGATNNISDLEGCVLHCRALCPRCADVSFSAAASDCSWYAACDMTRLDTRFAGFVTRQVS